MSSSVPRSKDVASQNEPKDFSLLTALFVGGAVLSAEVLIDIFFYPWGARIYPLQHLLNMIATDPLKRFGIPAIYGYAIRWWPPVAVITFVMGRLYGRRAVAWSLCGTLIYLVIEHNFRGIVGRHNVFEWADQDRHSYQPGVPDPYFWDAAYFIIAAVGAAAGAVFGRIRNRSRNGQFAAGVDAAVVFWAGCICLLVGIVETLVTIFVAARQDIYPMAPPITEGYAVLAYGAFLCWAAMFGSAAAEKLGFELA